MAPFRRSPPDCERLFCVWFASGTDIGLPKHLQYVSSEVGDVEDMLMDVLVLNWTERDVARPLNITFGAGGAERRFLDFTVNGVSLYAKLVQLKYDFISCLGWVGDDFDDDMRAQLLVKKPGTTRQGRVGLYVCPECVDPLCGTITVKVTETANTVEWSTLAYDSGWIDEPDLDVFRELADLGPFSFNKPSYQQVMNGIVRPT